MAGTFAHLELVSAYIVLFFGEKATLEQRVELAGFIVHFLRLARLHVVDTPGLTLKLNFFSRQTYQHVVLSCHSAVLLIRLQRDVNARLPVALFKSGSDCCETAFSQISGHGRLNARHRDGSVGEAVNGLSRLNTLTGWGADREARMRYGKRHHKADVDARTHENQALPVADLSRHQSDEVYAQAWRDGMTRAEAKAQILGISVPRSRARLWESEKVDVASMGEITAEEDADLAITAAAPDVTENALPLELPADDSDDEAYDACAVPSAPVERAPAAEAAPSAPVELVSAAEADLSIVDAVRLADVVARLGDEFDGSSDTPATARADPFLVLPTGGIGYKRAVIAQLNRMRPGERLSNDRLFRVRGVGARQGEAGSSSATPGTGAAEGERSALTTSGVLSLGSDFAMAFEVGSGVYASHEWWLGRVLALHRKAASGRSHGAVDEIELDGELQGVQVVAAWYEPQAGSQRSEYTLGTARADTTRYSLEHVLGLPRLDYSAETDTYRLVDTQSQLEALDAAMRLTMPERAGSARTHGEGREAERRRRERQHEVPPAPSAQSEAARDRGASALKRAAAREQQLTQIRG
jgi:hypothetical protein